MEYTYVRRISGTNAKVAAKLWNFETGKSYLLLDHQNFLDDEVRHVLRTTKGAWVDLYGYASRIGDANQNMTLSNQRINSVKSRLAEYANRIDFGIHVAYGETQSGPNERNNDALYRAVEIYVFAQKPPSPVPPVPKPNLRRIVFRSFSKDTFKPDLGGPGPPDLQKDAINELLKLGLSALKGELSAEGLLGTEASRRVSDLPSDHRVNKVSFNTERVYDIFVGGSQLTQFTQITYEWGPPKPEVVIEDRFQFAFGNEKKPPVTTTRTLPRKQAEETPLVVPPDPK